MTGGGMIWFNGRLVRGAPVVVHVMTHTLHYGSLGFEGTRCPGTPRDSGQVYRPAHLLPESTLRSRLEYV